MEKNIELRHHRCVQNVKVERVPKSKHNYDVVVSFIKQTTCFGPCTAPYSGLNLLFRGDYTVRVVLEVGSLQAQRDLIVSRYSHFLRAITMLTMYNNTLSVSWCGYNFYGVA